jgi:hypothetical protein
MDLESVLEERERALALSSVRTEVRSRCGMTMRCGVSRPVVRLEGQARGWGKNSQWIEQHGPAPAAEQQHGSGRAGRAGGTAGRGRDALVVASGLICASSVMVSPAPLCRFHPACAAAIHSFIDLNTTSAAVGVTLSDLCALTSLSSVSVHCQWLTGYM